MEADKMSYADKLKDVKWQKKRLEVLENHGWACDMCGASAKVNLQVHHKAYMRGKAPWEYQDDLLAVLCEDCHKAAQRNMEVIHLCVGFAGIKQINDLAATIFEYIKAEKASPGLAVDLFENTLKRAIAELKQSDSIDIGERRMRFIRDCNRWQEQHK